MAFLLPIPITLVAGLIWLAWVGRTRRPPDPATTVEQWSRAVRVLAPPAPPQPSRQRELARSA